MQDIATFDETARQTVELANRIADEQPEADVREIADGLLSGAVHYWLYAYQPCGEPGCEDCGPLATAEQRLARLIELVREYAVESEYFHSPNDRNAGRA
ncbi:MAG: hypothetical protein RML12_04490 [Xanthomonadales bacterium]|nr:hypothetical protein [Xanthomonadales bacterium]